MVPVSESESLWKSCNFICCHLSCSSSGSSSDSDSSSSESLRFDDGLDDELVGDEEDRKKLSLMTDVEREQEMYNR